MPLGWDPSSLGLLRKGPTNDDPRFTPVGFEGSIIWALHPKHFTPANILDIQKPYRDKGLTLTNEAEIYVDSIDVKGFVTNSESSIVTRQYVPVYAGPNAITKENPMDYAKSIEDISVDFEPNFISDLYKKLNPNPDGSGVVEVTAAAIQPIIESLGMNVDYAPWKLTYRPTLTGTTSGDDVEGETKEFTINLSSLPGIDMNSSLNVTVNAEGGQGSISYPLPNVKSGGQSTIKVKTYAHTMNGFWYTVSFNGRTIQGRYDNELTVKAILSDYTKHIIQNKYREIALIVSQVYNTGKSFLDNVSFESNPQEPTTPGDTSYYLGEKFKDADRIDKAGGITSILDGVMEYALRWAMLEDMKNTTSNVGGDFLTDALGKQIDMLLSIDYPIADEIQLVSGNTIKPGTFSVNETHNFKINSRFNGVTELLTEMNNNYPGQLVKVNGDLVFNYGKYNEYFLSLVSKGALLE